MRLVACAFSAVLLSGCSWMGGGAGGSYNYGYNGAGGCGASQYGYTSVAQYGYGTDGCAGAGSYAVAGMAGMNGGGAYGAGYGVGAGYGGATAYGTGAGYGGATGYGTGAGYGAGAGAGFGTGYGGAYGVGAGTGAYGTGVGTGALGLRGGVQGAGASGYGYGYGASGGGTVLGADAGYGTAVGGAQYVNGGQVAGQWVNGQWVSGATYGGGSVTTVQGAPIYVPQPYPAYYGVGVGGGLRGVSAALPFGLEAGIGTGFAIGGDIFQGAPSKPSGTNHISALPAISYNDAYKNAVSYDLTATYDLDPTTTLLGRIGYKSADGERLKVGTITDGTITEDLYAQWGDMEEVTLEGGVRKYMGGW
ncbi:MAG TPA: hypothetical protein ENJ42_04855, partial [Hellea balneolensis]|nr:hypothetical protein [Hellea balneolensis]